MKTILTTAGLFILINLSAQTITYSVMVTPATNSVSCDGSVQLTNVAGGCAPYSYVLDPGNIPSGNGVWQNLCSGTNYTVTITDAGGGSCAPVVQCTVCVDFNCGITSIKETASEYPHITFDNSTGTLYINCPPGKNLLQVFDLNGKLILEPAVIPGKNRIDLSLLQKGMYIVDFKTDDKHTIRQKVLKN